MTIEKIGKQNVGNTGEYYIASKLSALDFTVSITLGRAERFDILALRPDGKTLTFSIKTAQLEDVKGFPLSSKDEQNPADNFYYAFVKLNESKREPDFWIIPSHIVSELITTAHKNWLATAGRSGKVDHKDNSLRMLPIIVRDSEQKFYPENWQEEIHKYHKNLEQLTK